MFFGTYTPKLDDKSRLVLPAKFRDELAEGLVLAKGQERCLYVWSQAEFGRFTGKLQGASVTNKASREYIRVLYSGARDDPADKQGRLFIPADLRGYAGLDRDVVVVGVMDRVEIWDAATWASYSATKEPEYSDLDSPGFPGD